MRLANLTILMCCMLQLKRKDREIENIFSALQHTIEIRDSGLKRCSSLSQTHLPAIVAVVANAHSTCQETLERVNKLDSTIAAQVSRICFTIYVY